jgi:ammonia channel protein AmtB
LLKGVNGLPNADYVFRIPQNVFCTFQPPFAIITLIVRALIRLRPDGEIESQGLDIHDHGEEGYTLNG